MSNKFQVVPTIAITFLLLALMSTSSYAQCGGLCLYEVGHPLQGASSAGTGAAAQDASTVFFNPAGMTRLHGNEVLLGTVLLFGDIEFNLNESQSTTSDPNPSGGGQIGGFIPGGSAYAVVSLTDRLRLGLAFNGLYGGSVNYDNNWVGRTWVTDSSLTALNIEPTAAYRLTDWLSIGAGLNIVYASMDFEARMNSTSSLTIKIDQADDWAVAGTFGVLLELSKETRIGIMYRTKVELNLSGDLENPTPLLPAIDVDFDLAQGVNVSVFHQLTSKFALLGDAGWSDWSQFSMNNFAFGPASIGLDRDWQDTWRIGVGVQYQVLATTMLRGGFSYDSSPVKASKRLPDLPVGEQYRFSFGMQHNLSEVITASFSYTLIWSGPGDVDQVLLPPDGSVILDGDYDPFFIHVLGLTFSGRF